VRAGSKDDGGFEREGSLVPGEPCKASKRSRAGTKTTVGDVATPDEVGITSSTGSSDEGAREWPAEETGQNNRGHLEGKDGARAGLDREAAIERCKSG
jgi:hypothetical protein